VRVRDFGEHDSSDSDSDSDDDDDAPDFAKVRSQDLHGESVAVIIATV